ncbi:MAG: Crossover junction endodeoxyribonuclease RuvC [Pelotomaculum sp. PtaB.Bin104]|nr:MAG: Crossover junction endodeoxyribonuclease RuvC [Pelotomaculum sp. PtaB.Bin104]
MKIVGIDASLTGTGVAVLNGSLHTETIQSKKTGTERLIEIRERIRDIVNGADLVVLEDYAFSRPNQAHQIGELGGVLRVLFHEMGVKVLLVSTGQVKKFASGKGTADKRDIAIAVYKRFGQEFKTSDETDAFVLAKIGQAYHPGLYYEGMTAFQHEVIDALKSGKKPKKETKKMAV